MNYQRTVQFSDTDAAGLVHFSRLLCFVEEAEHARLLSLNIPVIDSTGGWPRVQVSCDYHAPLKFGDVVEITLEVAEMGETSLTWRFAVTQRGLNYAKGTIKTVRVDSDGKPTPIPQEWRDSLSPH